MNPLSRGRARTALLFFLISQAVLCGPAPLRGTALAAGFDLDAGRTVLRQLQYCRHCGSALLVSGLRAGEMLRCPDCGHEQPRIEDEHLLTQLYQLCSTCLGPLETAGHRPGDVVECDACHTRQELVDAAFLPEEYAAGLGYAPGFPPGSARKRLLFASDGADAPVPVFPIDDDPLADIPLPGINPAGALSIPRPPERAEGTATTGAVAAAATSLPAAAAAAVTAAPSAARSNNNEPSAGAITVPAVTADLFGGRRRATAESGAADSAAAGTLARGSVAARVNGVAIYAADVERVLAPVMRRLRERAGEAGARDIAGREAEVRREVLERLIDRELALGEAAALAHRPDPDAVRRRESELSRLLGGEPGVDFRREAERDVIMADMRRRNGARPGEVAPEAVRAFYQEHKGEMTRPRLIALDMLAVYAERSGHADGRDYRTIAGEIAARLEGGVKFADVRERYDEFFSGAGVAWREPALKPEGAYARAALAAGGDLRRGAVFGPVFMEGLVLFSKVADEQPAGAVPFEEVEAGIKARLEAETTERNLDAWLARLRGRAKIEYLN